MFNTKRTMSISLALAAVALLMSTPAQAVQPTERTFTYVAADFYVVGPDLVAAEVAEATGRHVAPLGTASVVPGGDRLTIVVDDAGTLSGHVPVSISGRPSAAFHCISVRRATTFRVVPGETTTITVWGAAFGAWSPCGSGATTGTLQVRA